MSIRTQFIKIAAVITTLFNSPSRAAGITACNFGIYNSDSFIVSPSSDGTVPFSGHVYEKATGKPVQSANVSLPDLGISTSTDTSGYYYFRAVPTGITRLQIQHISLVNYVKEITISEGS